MSCKFDQTMLYLYFDGELGPAASARVADHLSYCQDCQAQMRTLELLRSEIGRVCREVKAPEALRARILESLQNPVLSMSDLKIGFIEKLKMRIAEFQSRRFNFAGAVMAVILLLIFIPGGSNFQSMAGVLAKQHFKWQQAKQEHCVHSGEPVAISQYIEEQLGYQISVPGCLCDEYYLAGGGITELYGKQLAFVGYTHGDMSCTLFILNGSTIKPKRSDVMMISGREFEFGRTDDLNFIYWVKNHSTYILCGCCPHEKLVNLALAGI